MTSLDYPIYLTYKYVRFLEDRRRLESFAADTQASIVDNISRSSGTMNDSAAFDGELPLRTRTRARLSTFSVARTSFASTNMPRKSPRTSCRVDAAHDKGSHEEKEGRIDDSQHASGATRPRFSYILTSPSPSYTTSNTRESHVHVRSASASASLPTLSQHGHEKADRPVASLSVPPTILPFEVETPSAARSVASDGPIDSTNAISRNSNSHFMSFADKHSRAHEFDNGVRASLSHHEEMICDGKIKLRDILVDDAYQLERRNFIDHLVREFSVENIFFFQETREFYSFFTSHQHTKEEIGIAAIAVYFKFVASGAPYQV